MRTTLNIDDDTLDLVKHYAASRSVPLGRAFSELARQGLSAQPRTRIEHGLTVLDVPPNPRQPLSSQLVRELQDDEP